VLWLSRGDGLLQLIANLSPAPVDLPAGAAVLLASGPLPGGKLPPDTAVWIRAAADRSG
jgi:alpha-glucosidase